MTTRAAKAADYAVWLAQTAFGDPFNDEARAETLRNLFDPDALAGARRMLFERRAKRAGSGTGPDPALLDRALDLVHRAAPPVTAADIAAARRATAGVTTRVADLLADLLADVRAAPLVESALRNTLGDGDGASTDAVLSVNAELHRRPPTPAVTRARRIVDSLLPA